MLTPPGTRTGDPLDLLFSDRPMGAMEWGLERIEALLAALGNPHRAFDSIHIAGTNGKGSTSMFAAGMLRAHGARVGLYTSPHLHDIRERFVVDGTPAPDEVLRSVAARMLDLPETTPATYFETATALAFASFAEVGVEWAVVEAGLGGRLDATNVLTPRVAVVTTIGFDHSELLGSTLEAIAAEKAGIFKAGVPVALGPIPAPARPVLEDAASRIGAPVHVLGDETSVWDVTTSLEGTTFRYRSPRRVDDLVLSTPMIGEHQAQNAGLALLALETAGVAAEDESVGAALAGAVLPGRFEVRQHDAGITIYDIAHNREGLDVVLRTLGQLEAPRPHVAVVGILDDKPWSGMLGMLRLDMEAIILTQAPSAPKTRWWDLDAIVVEEEAGTAVVTVEPDLERALALARDAGEGGTVLVTGSTFTVGDARATAVPNRTPGE